jgi:hypothetical protein
VIKYRHSGLDAETGLLIGLRSSLQSAVSGACHYSETSVSKLLIRLMSTRTSIESDIIDDNKDFHPDRAPHDPLQITPAPDVFTFGI